MTDDEIADIARATSQKMRRENSAKVNHILNVLGKLYRPVGRSGLSVMLYAVAYEQGVRDKAEMLEIERGRLSALIQSVEDTAAKMCV